MFELYDYMHCAYTVVSKDFMLTLQLYDIIIPSQGAAQNVLCTSFAQHHQQTTMNMNNESTIYCSASKTANTSNQRRIVIEFEVPTVKLSLVIMI